MPLVSVDLLLLSALDAGVTDALGHGGLLLLAALHVGVADTLGLGGLLPYLYPCTCSGPPALASFPPSVPGASACTPRHGLHVPTQFFVLSDDDLPGPVLVVSVTSHLQVLPSLLHFLVCLVDSHPAAATSVTEMFVEQALAKQKN